MDFKMFDSVRYVDQEHSGFGFPKFGEFGIITKVIAKDKYSIHWKAEDDGWKRICSPYEGGQLKLVKRFDWEDVIK